VTFLSLFSPSRFFFFLLPVAIPYRGLSLRNVALASCCRKIQILSRVCKNIPRSRRSRSAFCGFLSLSLVLVLALYLSAFPRYWDRAHSAGFRQARMPLSALTVPLGSSPFPNPGMEDPWRAFPPAPRRDQCVMQVVTKKKIGWKRNPYPRRKTEVRRRWKEPSNDKRKLATSFCPPTLFPPLPPARRIFNGKIMRGICSREFPSSPFAGLESATKASRRL
jgi:hypothetical protein